MVKYSIMLKRISAFNIIVFIVVSHLCTGKSGIGPCDKYYNGCCPNTQWDSQHQQCIDCNEGYYWFNCSRRCPYPQYGKKCLQNCTCKEEACNFMTGCTLDDGFHKQTTDNTINIHTAKYTNYFSKIKSTVYTRVPRNQNGTGTFRDPKKTKYTLLIIGSLVFCGVFIAYTVVLIIDKHLEKKLKFNGQITR